LPVTHKLRAPIPTPTAAKWIHWRPFSIAIWGFSN